MQNIIINQHIIPRSAIDTIKLLKSYGYEAYLVGGCVRDLLLNEHPHDWDMCTNATPEEIKCILKANKYKFHTVGEEFGTITALLDNEYEITTYRSETTYSDNRHPDSINFSKTITEDLKRRDFTINAMAYDPCEHELIDIFNGYNDLQTRTLSAVGIANERFNEDALRILRALRFAIKYDLIIETKTYEAMKNNHNLLKNVSKERVTAELEKMLTCGSSIEYWFTECSWLIAEIIPELEPSFNFSQNNKYHQHDVYTHILKVVDNSDTEKFEIKLAALLHDIGKPHTYTIDNEGWGHFYGHSDVSYELAKNVLTKDLRVTSECKDLILNLVKHHDMTIPRTKPAVKRMLNKFGEDFINDWLILKQADINDHIFDNVRGPILLNANYIKDTIKEIYDENECFKIKDLQINGNDIMNLFNIKQGKEIGFILNQLFEDVIEEKIDNCFSALAQRATEIHNELESDLNKECR